VLAGKIGNLAWASSSSGFSAVVIAPWKKSLAASRRSPVVLTATISASSMAATRPHSAAGSASSDALAPPQHLSGLSRRPKAADNRAYNSGIRGMSVEDR
jgi:hypothetical protein